MFEKVSMSERIWDCARSLRANEAVCAKRSLTVPPARAKWMSPSIDRGMLSCLNPLVE